MLICGESGRRLRQQIPRIPEGLAALTLTRPESSAFFVFISRCFVPFWGHKHEGYELTADKH